MGHSSRPFIVGTLLIALISGACGADLDATSFLRVDASEFALLVREARANPDIELLDLRTPEEVATGFIAGAVNVDTLDPRFLEAIEQLDTDHHFLLYARSSAASAEAARILKDAGFTHLTELNGGIEAWVSSGRSLESP